jgi:PAS domain S-box-containing protein
MIPVTDPRNLTIREMAEPFDIAGQSVIATSADGTIVYWSKGAVELYGWEAREAVGRNIVDITPTSQTRQQAIEIMTLLAEGETSSGRFRVRRRDGSEFLVHVRDVPVLDRSGNLIGIVGISKPA